MRCCSYQNANLHKIHAHTTLTAAKNGPTGKSFLSRSGDDAARVQWWAMAYVPPLAFDHDMILRLALHGQTGGGGCDFLGHNGRL